MENNYLIIIASLMAFYLIFMLYIKSVSKFTPVSNVMVPVQETPVPNTSYETEDTRIQHPLLAPVNPMARYSNVQTVLPASSDLYSSQTYETSDYLLNTPPTENTNQLIYSGGETQLINIPLQYNYPYNEQLRTQQVLITPYNKIKYGTC